MQAVCRWCETPLTGAQRNCCGQGPCVRARARSYAKRWRRCSFKAHAARWWELSRRKLKRLGYSRAVIRERRERFRQLARQRRG